LDFFDLEGALEGLFDLLLGLLELLDFLLGLLDFFLLGLFERGLRLDDLKIKM